MNILLGVTGSIAAKLTSKFVKKLQEQGHNVQVILTEAAKYFTEGEYDGAKVWSDKDEFPIKYESVKEDGSLFIPHIELGRWADVLIIAPLTANTLAKMANGICDNLLTCTIMAFGNKPIVIAPAMNTNMLLNPIMQSNVAKIAQGYIWKYPWSLEYFDCKMVVYHKPIQKKLACGEVGIGAMDDINSILETIKELDRLKKAR